MLKNSAITHVDTIAAQATAHGRGGIAIVRISGSLVQKIMHDILQQTLEPRLAHYLPFLDTNAQAIDEGLALFFPSPNSFTGEDVLELHGHGGPVVVDMLLQRILNLGARLAKPGEFSERAFLNNKIDLTQAEAIADLIDASSEQAARLALRSLQGEFAKKIDELNHNIIQLRMHIESAIDFADEEIDFLSIEKLAVAFTEVLNAIEKIQTQAQQGSLLREGFAAVIIGEPNVGKSSLLNRLSGKEIAIVTDIAGTTRDILRDHILIDDIPMHIIDTAGLRDSSDRVEQEGIRRAYAEIEKADLILYVTDKAIDDANLPENIISRPHILIHNKIDLSHTAAQIENKNEKTIIYLSAKSGEGIDLLKQQIKHKIGFKKEGQGIFLARRRHLDALARAYAHLQAGLQQLRLTKATELIAEDLRLAQRALNEITGEFTADDLLGKIFANFCIGK